MQNSSLPAFLATGRYDLRYDYVIESGSEDEAAADYDSESNQSHYNEKGCSENVKNKHTILVFAFTYTLGFL